MNQAGTAQLDPGMTFFDGLILTKFIGYNLEISTQLGTDFIILLSNFEKKCLIILKVVAFIENWIFALFSFTIEYN